MRAGACAVQQTLTAEAASVLKHSLSLARRRGHAQITPLHVAATLLSSRASLLKRACLKSQPHQTSHPLQFRALELCFNVALNRLPTAPVPFLHNQPSLSNALIAALKRAQAHQRRGCIEQQQQQPLLTVKVELEQLIISILDDPSVSRVMREAGFSSTSVKNNLEDSSVCPVFHCYSSSGGVFSSPCSPSRNHRDFTNSPSFWQTHFLNFSSDQNPSLFTPHRKLFQTSHPTDSEASVKEDFDLLLEVLLRKKKRNTVIVGDNVSLTEGLVSELIVRVEKGGVPDELLSAHFIRFHFPPVALMFMKREDVEMSLADLKRKVDSLASGGVIIYAGDLKWTLDEREIERFPKKEVSGYSPADHLVAEIGRLLYEYSSSNSKVWLIATATYQTYMRCQIKQPPLETQWTLQAISVPSGGLGLSLHATSSAYESKAGFSQISSLMVETKPFIKCEEHDKLKCCIECTSNYEQEAALFKSGQNKLLPPWLQPQRAESQQKDELVELRRKWSILCQSLHHGRASNSLYNNQKPVGNTYSYSLYPWWPSQNSILPETSSISLTHSSKPGHSSNHVARFKRQQSCIDVSFGAETNDVLQVKKPTLDFLRNTEGRDEKITLALGHSLFSDPETKREKMVLEEDIREMFQENFPWQSSIIPSIVESLSDPISRKKDTWLLIQGDDSIGKKRLALAVSEAIFGSTDFLLCMNMRKCKNELTPDSEILTEAMRGKEKLVVLVENVDFADTHLMKLLADLFERTKMGETEIKHEGSFCQMVFILTRGESACFEDGTNSHSSLIKLNLQVKKTSPSLLGSNLGPKRKSEWGILSNRSKSPRTDEREEASSANSTDNEDTNKAYSKHQSSFTALDLNIKADEDDDKQGGNSPISSDLTGETGSEIKSHNGFLDLIEHRYFFNQDLDRSTQMTEAILTKFRESFHGVFKGESTAYFCVEHKVIEEVVKNSGNFLSSLFEKWLKDIFESSLQTGKIGGKEEGIGVVRLCFEGKGDRNLEGGYMGTALPKKIQVSFMG